MSWRVFGFVVVVCWFDVGVWPMLENGALLSGVRRRSCRMQWFALVFCGDGDGDAGLMELSNAVVCARDLWNIHSWSWCLISLVG